MNRQQLGQQALHMALRTRSNAGADLISPVCPFDIAESLGIGVRFVAINMEGLYVRDPTPTALISILRPFGRRNFTCGHEIGHHVFGHGFNLDNVVPKTNADCYGFGTPEEFVADSFAGCLLLPSLGVRRAFALRGWDLSQPQPLQLLSVATEFGVGYTTLVHHMWHNLRVFGAATSKRLLRESPKSIRSDFLGYESSCALVITDEHWLAKTIDLELGAEVLLPDGALPETGLLAPVVESPRSNHFAAVRPGIVRVSSARWSIFVRIMPTQYEGLAKYRHLERQDEP